CASGKLNSSASNNAFGISVLSWDTETRTTDEEFAHLALAEPVAPDNVPPIWAAGSSVVMQPACSQLILAPSAEISDAFALPDPSSLLWSLDGTKTDGSASSLSISSFTLSTPNDGQTIGLQAPAPMVPDGLYQVHLSGADLAGNAALPNPLTSGSFRINTV